MKIIKINGLHTWLAIFHHNFALSVKITVPFLLTTKYCCIKSEELDIREAFLGRGQIKKLQPVEIINNISLGYKDV